MSDKKDIIDSLFDDIFADAKKGEAKKSESVPPAAKSISPSGDEKDSIFQKSPPPPPPPETKDPATQSAIIAASKVKITGTTPPVSDNLKVAADINLVKWGADLRI